MKQSKIQSATFESSFTGKYGTLYSHLITLDNGDSGQINCKEEMPNWLIKGNELSYEITPGGKYPDKIKRVNPDYANKNGSSEPNKPDNQLIERIEKLEDKVERMSQYLQKGKPEKVDRDLEVSRDSQKKYEDDLPF